MPGQHSTTAESRTIVDLPNARIDQASKSTWKAWSSNMKHMTCCTDLNSVPWTARRHGQLAGSVTADIEHVRILVLVAGRCESVNNASLQGP